MMEHTHKILSNHKLHKKGNYIEACLDWRLHLILLVFEVDGDMGEETKTATKQLYTDLMNKWDREY